MARFAGFQTETLLADVIGRAAKIMRITPGETARDAVAPKPGPRRTLQQARL